MTEDKWLACADSVPMLEYAIGRLPARKVRLFACGLCRRFWDLLQDKRSRKAVVVAERFADGLATDRDRRAAETAAQAASRRLYKEADPEMDEGSEASLALRAAYLAAYVTSDEPFWGRTAEGSFYLLDRFAEASFISGRARPLRVAYQVQAEQLRDITGNIFRPVVLDRGSLPPLAVAMAETMYEERCFEDLPILADALEDAGCDNADILSHCRGPGPHVRGCWVLDLLLGRE
jgi:hypothetical protein